MPHTQPEIYPVKTGAGALSDAIEQLRVSHRPLTLMVDGKPAAVLQDPVEYERLLEQVEAAEVRESIRAGLDDIATGRIRPADDFFAEMRRKHAIPR